MGRHWAIIFVFAISLLAVGILLFLAATSPAIQQTDAWTFWIMAALACAVVTGAFSLGDLTRIATRDGTRPLASMP